MYTSFRMSLVYYYFHHVPFLKAAAWSLKAVMWFATQWEKRVSSPSLGVSD